MNECMHDSDCERWSDNIVYDVFTGVCNGSGYCRPIGYIWGYPQGEYDGDVVCHNLSVGALCMNPDGYGTGTRRTTGRRRLPDTSGYRTHQATGRQLGGK